jgi:hypothetical protein
MNEATLVNCYFALSNHKRVICAVKSLFTLSERGDFVLSGLEKTAKFEIK